MKEVEQRITMTEMFTFRKSQKAILREREIYIKG